MISTSVLKFVNEIFVQNIAIYTLIAMHYTGDQVSKFNL